MKTAVKNEKVKVIAKKKTTKRQKSKVPELLKYMKFCDYGIHPSLPPIKIQNS